MYTDKYYALEPLGTPAAVVLTAAGVHTYSKLNGDKFAITKLKALITVATVSTGNIVIQLLARPTPGSAVGQVVVGFLTIPTLATVGSVYEKDVAETQILPGTQLVYNVLTAAAGGGAAGAAMGMYSGYEFPETKANEPTVFAG